MQHSRSKKRLAPTNKLAATISWLFRVLVIISAVGVMTVVVGIGLYFFIDQVVIEELDLRTPEEKIARAVTHMTSMVRDPDDQYAAIEVMRANFPLVDEQTKLEAIEQVDVILPTRTVAAEIIDAWIAFRKIALGRVVVGPSSPIDALTNWKAGSDYAKFRIAMYMDPSLTCDPDMRALAAFATTAETASEVEKRLASQVELRWLEAGTCAQP